MVAYETRSRTAREVGTHHFIAYGFQGRDSAGFGRTLADDPGCNGFGPADFFRKTSFIVELKGVHDAAGNLASGVQLTIVLATGEITVPGIGTFPSGAIPDTRIPFMVERGER